LPTTRGVFAPDVRFVPQVFYDTYNSTGNLLTVRQASGSPTAYQWGYQQQYPVAQVHNARSSNIFFDNFEEGNGNTLLGDAKTGHYSYSGGYTRVLTGLDNGVYVLSYWQKNGTLWSLHYDQVTVNKGTYTIELTGQIDDVQAQVPTSLAPPLQLHLSPDVSVTAGQAATLQASATQVPSALAFDGIDDVVHVFDANNPTQLAHLADVTNNFTVEAWVWPTATHEVDMQSRSGVSG
nr:hypothetical protein [Tanacetum cinerariifolium]